MPYLVPMVERSGPTHWPWPWTRWQLAQRVQAGPEEDGRGPARRRRRGGSARRSAAGAGRWRVLGRGRTLAASSRIRRSGCRVQERGRLGLQVVGQLAGLRPARGSAGAAALSRASVRRASRRRPSGYVARVDQLGQPARGVVDRRAGSAPPPRRPGWSWACPLVPAIRRSRSVRPAGRRWLAERLDRRDAQLIGQRSRPGRSPRGRPRSGRRRWPRPARSPATRSSGSSQRLLDGLDRPRGSFCAACQSPASFRPAVARNCRLRAGSLALGGQLGHDRAAARVA